MNKFKYFLIVLSFLPACGTARITGTEQNIKRGLANRSPATYLDEDSDEKENGLFLSVPNFQLAKKEQQYNPIIGIYSNPDAPPVADAIASARTSVDIEIYEMADPEVLNAILQAIKNNVKVRVVKDPNPVGPRCNPFYPMMGKAPKTQNSDDCKLQVKVAEAIRKSNGGEYVPYNKNVFCGNKNKYGGACFQHGKMIIVDDQFALLSTGNFNPTSLCNLSVKPEKCNRDYSYITRDKESVFALKEIFERDLKGKAYDLPSILNRGQLKDKITVSPYSFEPLAAFIRSAQQSVQIQNQYIRDKDLASVIIEKAKAGIKVEVLLSDVCNYGPISEKLARDSDLMFRAFTDAGIQLKMFYKDRKIKEKPGYLHSKAIVIDGELSDRRKAWVGSVNGSATSLHVNREFGIFFSNPRRVTELSDFMKKDFMDPTNITWQKSVLECPRKLIKNQKKTKKQKTKNKIEKPALDSLLDEPLPEAPDL